MGAIVKDARVSLVDQETDIRWSLYTDDGAVTIEKIVQNAKDETQDEYFTIPTSVLVNLFAMFAPTIVDGNGNRVRFVLPGG